MLTIQRVDEIIKGLIKQDIKYSKSPEGIYYIKGGGQTVVNGTEDAFQLNPPGELAIRESLKTYVDRVLIDVGNGESSVYMATHLMRTRANEFLKSFDEPIIILNHEFQMPGYSDSYCRIMENAPTKIEIRYYLEVFKGEKE